MELSQKKRTPFIEKIKDKNQRIIKIYGKKVLSYHKALSRKELTKELNKLQNKLEKSINSEKMMRQKMLNYLYKDNLSDEIKKTLIEERFYKEVGYFPNIDNPVTFNEKINWLKLYYKNDVITRCVDKYEFKNYIKKELGEGYTVPLIGVWDNAGDIDITKLPDKFVLKVNWSSYQNFIVKDKNNFDFDYAKYMLNSWMLPWRNVYFSSFYYGYKNVVPKIIAEEYIEQTDGKLNDYKFYCFNGSPEYLYIVDEGFSKYRPLCWDVDTNHIYKIVEGKINSPKQPESMNEMIEIAKKLSKPFPFVRVDFYEVQGKVYVGEMTFYPGNGFNKFEPKSLDMELGLLLKLPINNDLDK